MLRKKSPVQKERREEENDVYSLATFSMDNWHPVVCSALNEPDLLREC